MFIARRNTQLTTSGRDYQLVLTPQPRSSGDDQRLTIIIETRRWKPVEKPLKGREPRRQNVHDDGLSPSVMTALATDRYRGKVFSFFRAFGFKALRGKKCLQRNRRFCSNHFVVVQRMRCKCLVQFIVINHQSVQIIKHFVPGLTNLAKSVIAP